MCILADFSSRDPEDRVVNAADWKAKREKMLDKTIADSFPASDPPSSLPDPNEDSFLSEAENAADESNSADWCEEILVRSEEGGEMVNQDKIRRGASGRKRVA